ncbi:hypothetical protein [Candidatus Tisiphia endosymbiont of Hybos culiciformis]
MWIATTTMWSRNDGSTLIHRHCKKTVGRRSNCKMSFPRRRESRSLLSQG